MTDDLPECDHLILLVGGNPLPNAVAGKLLAKQDTAITLIHSKGERGNEEDKHGTFRIAQKLQGWFSKQGFKQATLVGVHESDAESIMTAVQNALKQVDHHSTVGLHYTGGTKAMAVHAYRATETWAKENHATPCYTYLDAHTLSLSIDPPHPQQDQRYVGRSVKIELENLLDLHSWSWKEPPTTQPFLPTISEALHQVYQDKDSREAWNTWKKDVLMTLCTRQENREKWLPPSKLREISLPMPTHMHLQNVTAAMQKELGGNDGQLSLAEAAKRCGYKEKEIEKVCKWLNGGFWLETVVLQALQALEQACYLHDISMNLLPRFPDSPPQNNVFEFDVVALRGYQLFAFSCGTDSETEKGGRERLKLKLVEAYVRARQIGGDEARVALVCCAEKPHELEQEMYHALDAEGRIKVFGQQQLANLTEEIQAWVEEQSKEG